MFKVISLALRAFVHFRVLRALEEYCKMLREIKEYTFLGAFAHF